MPYRAHIDFVAPARRNVGLPQLVIGVIAIELLYELALYLMGRGLGLVPFLSMEQVLFGDTATGLLVQLFSFGFLIGVVVLVAWRQHQYGLRGLIGDPSPALRNLIRVALTLGALLILIEALPPHWAQPEATVTRNPAWWLLILPVSLLALTVQTGAEELFYRGYVQQQVAARFAHPAIWLVLPNVMFAFAHWENGAPEVINLQYVIWTFVFGLAASDLTARTGNLGAAIGFHLINNAYAFLFFGEQGGPDSGLALYLFPTGTMAAPAVDGPIFTMTLVTELALTGVMWLAARVAIRR